MFSFMNTESPVVYSPLQKIAIVLATYNPDPDFLGQQVESIRQQTWQNWICHIVDDHSTVEAQDLICQLVEGDRRFVLHFHDNNVRAYHNFERGLGYVQADQAVDAIAFADQDDIWLPHKLARLAGALEDERAILAHSDMALINDQNQLLHPSVWSFEKRKPEILNFYRLLIRNTVTGCTMLFRKSLLTCALPFPKQSQDQDWFHDYWIALIATTQGKIIHIREPLVHYRAHQNNTIGAVKDTGTLSKEISLLRAKKWKFTFRSYRIHRDLSYAFFDRCQSPNLSSHTNPFSDQQIDFGVRILWLGFINFLSGYGGEGIALRIAFNKFVFDLIKVSELPHKIRL
jgi:glycosyltransferase involved in cell wall biosynthesis